MCSSTDPIGIIGAMQVEVDTLISNLQDPHRLDKARTSFFEGHLCGKPVVVVRSGVGKVNASSCAQVLSRAISKSVMSLLQAIVLNTIWT